MSGRPGLSRFENPGDAEDAEVVAIYPLYLFYNTL
jgi:hypothetical protein